MKTTDSRVLPERYAAAKADAMKTCRTLYQGRKLPMTKSLMCFGWECPESWNELLRDLSYKLEALNVQFYPKYRVRIEAEQVKEKFGTLRFYYRVVTDLPYLVRCWSDMAEAIAGKLRRADFRYKTVVDKPARKGYDFREITADTYAKRTDPNGCKCSNAAYFERCGKYYEMVELSRMAETHRVPTRRLFRHAAAKLADRFAVWLDFSAIWKETSSQRVVSEYVDGLAQAYVRDAEHESESTCAACGRQIGTEWQPACVTKGWITYLCEDCAKASGHGYTVCGAKGKNEKETA